MTKQPNPLLPAQRAVVDRIGWHGLAMPAEALEERLDWLESVLQDCALTIITLQNRIMEEGLAQEEVYNALHRVRTTLTDALGS